MKVHGAEPSSDIVRPPDFGISSTTLPTKRFEFDITSTCSAPDMVIGKSKRLYHTLGPGEIGLLALLPGKAVAHVWCSLQATFMSSGGRILHRF